MSAHSKQKTQQFVKELQLQIIISKKKLLTENQPLLVFDCDGVLVDSEPISNSIFQQMILQLGVSLSLQQTIDTFVGRTMNACKEILESQFQATVPPDFLEQFDAKCFAAFQRELKPVAGVQELLHHVHSIPRCVASSGSYQKINTTLTITNLLQEFQPNIFSATEVARSKPAPDIFLFAAQKMNTLPSNCIVIEDSPLGVEGALAAGMRAIAYVERTPFHKFQHFNVPMCSTMTEVHAVLKDYLDL